MKNLLIIICIGVILGAPSDIQPPAGSSDSHSDNYCSRGIKLKNINKQKPNRLILIYESERKDFSTRNYTFEELNELEFDELIDLIVTLEWWEIDGLFEFSDGSYEFYSDTLRMQALFDAAEDRGNIYTPEDDLGIEVLVEVIRSGFYLAFYYEELNFLREFEFMDNTIPGIDAICNNPNFGFGTESQIRIIKAFGAYQGIGMTSIFSLSRSTEIFEDFYLNFDNYIDDWYISNALYWLGSGVQYALYTFSYNFEPDETEFYGAVDDLFNAIAQIGLYGTITSDNEWLLNNAVWWNAHIGLFMNEQLVVQFLTDVVELYGEWTAPSLEAVEMLCYLYNCEYADGTPIDEDGIIESVHNWLLPSRTTFDDETIIFKTGDAVTPEKINITTIGKVNGNTQITTNMGINKSSDWTWYNPYYQPDVIGVSNYTFTNIPDDLYRVVLSSKGLTNRTSINESDTYSLSHYNNNEDVVIMGLMNDGTALYKIIENVSVGETHTVDFSVLQQAEQKVIINLTGEDCCFWNGLTGHYEDDSFIQYNRYRLSYGGREGVDWDADLNFIANYPPSFTKFHTGLTVGQYNTPGEKD